MCKINKEKAEAIYKKSLEVLNIVQLENGGCLASPPGSRYPYVYPRDHAYIILSFISAKKFEEAKKAFEFVFNAQLKNGAFPQRFNKNGENASYKPIQLDGSGLILNALIEYYKQSKDKDFIKQIEGNIHHAISYIKNNYHEEKQLLYTPNSIHEFPPHEAGFEIYANAVCAGALLNLNKLSDTINFPDNYYKLGASLKNGIEKYLWNDRVKSFIKVIRTAESSSVETYIDASTIALSDFGVFDVSHEKMIQTVNRIDTKLWNKNVGGTNRYPKHVGRNNSGWGSWTHFTLMLAQYYIEIGNKPKAEQYLDWVLKISYENLLPEHISTVAEFDEYINDYSEAGIMRPDRLLMSENIKKHSTFKKGLAYSVLPLAWAHAQFIIAWNMYIQKWHIN